MLAKGSVSGGRLWVSLLAFFQGLHGESLALLLVISWGGNFVERKEHGRWGAVLPTCWVTFVPCLPFPGLSFSL